VKQRIHISVVEARRGLSHWLRRLKEGPITRRGKPVGVLIAPEKYEELRRVQAYLQVLRLSRSLAESGVTADELLHASREDPEGQG
jgi:prevent-host-death family protein